MSKTWTKNSKNKQDIDSLLPDGVTINEPIPSDFHYQKKHNFTDPDFGTFSSSVYGLMQANKSTHPKKVKIRQEATRNANPEKKKEIYRKAQETIRKNGFEASNQKRIQTCLDKYGVEHKSSTPEFRQSVVETNMARYGVPNVRQSLEINKDGMLLPNGKFLSAYCRELNKDGKRASAKRIYRLVSPQDAQEYIETSEFPVSILEKIISELLQIPIHNKTVLKDRRFRPDFLIGNLAIDVDGLHCHSEKRKDNKYHMQKREAYEKEGFQLLQFRQDEIFEKAEIVKSIINAKLNKFENTFFARKLEIKTMPQAKIDAFLKDNHLMGASKGVKNVCLCNGDNIVAAITYKKLGTGLDIVRYCNLLNTQVIGGLDRLLSFLKKENPTHIQSFVDLRYGNGTSLIRRGFTLKKVTLGWKWTNGLQTFNRLQCRANMDERRLTEKQHAEELGWYKIYDAGQANFQKQL